MKQKYLKPNIKKDGMLIDVSITAKGVELDGNIYLYASSRDITSLKAAQNEIITNNDSLQLLLGINPRRYAYF